MKPRKVPEWITHDEEDGHVVNLAEISKHTHLHTHLTPLFIFKEAYEPDRFNKTYAKRLEAFCHEKSQELTSKISQIRDDSDEIRDLVYECLVYSTPGVPWASSETGKAAHALLAAVLELPTVKAGGAATEEALVLSVLNGLTKKVFKPGVQGPAENADPTLLHAIVHCFTAYVKYPHLSQHAEYVMDLSRYLLDNKDCVYDLRAMGAALLNHSALNLNAAEYRWYRETAKREITSNLWSHEPGLLRVLIPCTVSTCRILSDDRDFVESVLEIWIKCITLATENSIKTVFVRHLTQMLDVCPLDMVILSLKQLVPLVSELVLMSDTETRAAAAQATLWIVSKCWVRVKPYCMVIARHCALSYVDWADVEGNDELVGTIKQVLSKLLLLCDGDESARGDLEEVINVAEIEMN